MSPLEPYPSLFLSGLPSLTQPPRVARPSLYHIDTDFSSKVSSQHDAPRQATSHRHTRSLEVPTRPVPSSTSDHPNSAASDSFLVSWTKERPALEPPTPLPGLYISQSSRKNSGSGSCSTRVPPLIPVLPPFVPVVSPPSPTFDSSEDTGDSEEEAESEDVWELIPYDISWGPAYYGYKEGSLPGPDGRCIFLRSPTPLKYQRTGQACEKCRERKAKCSGTRPSCARCATRGLTCEYAPDTKRARSEDLEDEGEKCAVPVDLHWARSSSANSFIAPSAGRMRRHTEYVASSTVFHYSISAYEFFDSNFGFNTSCNSHGARVQSKSSDGALRRRHSTIGLSVSASPVSRGLGLRASREPRLSRRVAQNNIEKGSLGALLDPFIPFSGNGAEDDDLPVSDCNGAAYQTFLQDTDSYSSQTFPLSSDSRIGLFGDAASDHFSDGEPRFNEWETQSHIPNCVRSGDNMLEMFAAPYDSVEAHSSVLGGLHSSTTMFDAECAHHVPGPGDLQSCAVWEARSDSEINECSVEANRDSSGASYIDMALPSQEPLWQCDAVVAMKVDTASFSSSIDPPHIAVPGYTPDFYHFDQNEDAMTWFPLSDL